MHILQPSEERVAKNALLMHAMKELYGPGAEQPRQALGRIDASKLPGLQQQIIDAAIALKLALRNFKQDDTQAKSNQP